LHPTQYDALKETSVSNRVLSEKDAARKTGLSPSFLRKLRYTGGGPAYIQLAERRIGYRENDLDRWIEERRVPAVDAA
jgi:predicted DNA-binding transcriptional regulator AlpA